MENSSAVNDTLELSPYTNPIQLTTKSPEVFDMNCNPSLPVR